MDFSFIAAASGLAVLWLLSLFLEVWLTGRSKAAGLILPILSLLLPLGLFFNQIAAGGLESRGLLLAAAAILPSLVYFLLYRFCLKKKQQL